MPGAYQPHGGSTAVSRGKDFARPRPAGKPAAPRRTPPQRPRAAAPLPRGSTAGLPVWVWMVVCVAFALAGAAFMAVSRQADPLAMAPSSAKAAPPPVELPPKEPSRFAFYEMLPSYEVVVPENEVRAAPKPSVKPPANPTALPAATSPESARAEAALNGQSASATPAAHTGSSERYLIQVAAYRVRADAEQQRERLSQTGLAARVEQVTIDNTQTWFRVRLGPYTDMPSASTALARLQAQGFKGVVMRVKT